MWNVDPFKGYIIFNYFLLKRLFLGRHALIFFEYFYIVKRWRNGVVDDIYFEICLEEERLAS